MAKKLGFYRKKKFSNKSLIALFEENQRIRFQSKDKDWESKEFVRKLSLQEKKISKEVLKMLEGGKIRTPDDFYRAGFIFQHGYEYNSYSLAVSLSAASMFMGEPWAKVLFASAVDRFLLSVGQPQIFLTQFELNSENKWVLSAYNKKVSNKIRKLFNTGDLREALRQQKELNRK